MKTLVNWKEFIAIFGVLIVLAVLALPFLTRARETAMRASCANNLKQIGTILKMYSSEDPHGRFPPLSRRFNNWIFDVPTLHPEYMTDLSVLVCPDSPFAGSDTFRSREGPRGGGYSPECVTSLFYVYTGYVIYSDEQALALFEAYQRDPQRVMAMQMQSLQVPVWEHSNRIHGGVGKYGMPVVWDRPFVNPQWFAHRPLGGNVLHMDGHVEFVPYAHYNNSNYFPMTRISAETFGSVLPRALPHCGG